MVNTLHTDDDDDDDDEQVAAVKVKNHVINCCIVRIFIH